MLEWAHQKIKTQNSLIIIIIEGDGKDEGDGEGLG